MTIARLLLNVAAAGRRDALDRRVQDARDCLRQARTAGPDVRRADLSLSDDPILVMDSQERLLGIITAYDLL
jgi:hypothetical protein